jgi:hypothetical protein
LTKRNFYNADEEFIMSQDRAWVAKATKQPLTLETVDLGPPGVEDAEL